MNLKKEVKNSGTLPLIVSFCFVALRPKSTPMAMAWRSVHRTTLFPGQSWKSGWPVLCAHTFACNWQQLFLNDSAEGRRMTVEMISWSISTKVWDLAGIELAIPGTAVRHASVVRHATLPAALRGPVYLSVNLFESRSAPTQYRAWYGSKRFANAISTCKTSPLVRKRLHNICIVCIHINSLWLFGLHIHRMHAHQSSGVRGRLYFVPIGQQRHWRNYIYGGSLCCSHIYLMLYINIWLKCEATKT